MILLRLASAALLLTSLACAWQPQAKDPAERLARRRAELDQLDAQAGMSQDWQGRPRRQAWVPAAAEVIPSTH